MSTNAYIGIKRENGDIEGIYSHWDGYVDYLGNMLNRYYSSTEKVNQLISLGDVSILNERIAPDEGEFHSFEDPLDDVTIFYGRDRGETGVEAQILHSHKDNLKESPFFNMSYSYLWIEDENDFEVYDSGSLLGMLSEILIEE